MIKIILGLGHQSWVSIFILFNIDLTSLPRLLGIKTQQKVFPRSQRRIWISNLQPCTEYSFRVVSVTEAGDMGHSEAKCFTKSIEIIQKNSNSLAANLQKEIQMTEEDLARSENVRL